MNYKNHLTHWRGKPLRELTRDEAIEAMQEYNRLYQGALDNIKRQMSKSGNSEFSVST